MKHKRLCDEDCSHCEAMENREVALLMNVLYRFYGDSVIQLANEVCPNMTCCPDCRIDDMTHMAEGCEIYEEAERIVETLCKRHREYASLHAIFAAVDSLAGDLQEAKAELVDAGGEA